MFDVLVRFLADSTDPGVSPRHYYHVDVRCFFVLTDLGSVLLYLVLHVKSFSNVQ